MCKSINIVIYSYFQAEIRATGQEIVAKRMRLTQNCCLFQSETKLLEEIRTLRSLHHPNVLKYVDVYRDMGRLYLLAGGFLDLMGVCFSHGVWLFGRW